MVQHLLLSLLYTIVALILIKIINIQYILLHFFALIFILCNMSIHNLHLFIWNLTIYFTSCIFWFSFLKIIAILFFFSFIFEANKLHISFSFCWCIGIFIIFWDILKLNSLFLLTLPLSLVNNVRRWAHFFNQIKNPVHRQATTCFSEKVLIFFDDQQWKNHIHNNYDKQIDKDNKLFHSQSRISYDADTTVER